MEIKKLGFGLMRLPVLDGNAENIDMNKLFDMVDEFLKKGFTYFDTSYVYHNGQSAIATRKALVERHPRDSFLLANKLPTFIITQQEQVDSLFKEQLEQCGVDYFDYYLLHNLNEERYEKVVEKFGIFEYVSKMKEEGHIKHMGFSFHDSADVLDRILTEHPEVEFVQIVLNYHDLTSKSIESKACYDVIRKHGKKVVIMEPVKGGTLAELPKKAEQLLKNYNPKMSIASWAIRFAASFDGVISVLSGMSDMQQVMDNTSYMEKFEPLSVEELDLLKEVVEIMDSNLVIPCKYCEKCNFVCPKKIPISNCIAYYNETMQERDITLNSELCYYKNLIRHCGGAADCIGCHECEKQCSENINIVDSMKTISEYFDKYAI